MPQIEELMQYTQSVKFTMEKVRQHNDLTSHDDEMLRQQIERAEELLEGKVMENRLKEIITKIAILNELSLAGADHETYLDDLIESISKDDVMSSMLLRAQSDLEGK